MLLQLSSAIQRPKQHRQCSKTRVYLLHLIIHALLSETNTMQIVAFLTTSRCSSKWLFVWPTWRVEIEKKEHAAFMLCVGLQYDYFI